MKFEIKILGQNDDKKNKKLWRARSVFSSLIGARPTLSRGARPAFILLLIMIPHPRIETLYERGYGTFDELPKYVQEFARQTNEKLS